MAYSGNKFLFENIVPDENDDLSGMDLLGERLQEMSESDNPDRQLNYQKTKESGKDGYNVRLPGGVDFRIEEGKITFSKFGLSKEELKSVYSYLNTLSIVGLSFDPEEPEDFKQTAIEARNELKNEDGSYESNGVFGEALNAAVRQADERTQSAANSNNPSQIQTEGMSDEERLEIIRQAAGALKDKFQPQIAQGVKKKPHPNVDDIEKYMDEHITNTQKYKSKNYRKRSLSNGWEMTWYKDADQKKEGATADKKGRINQNFDFGLRGEIAYKNDKPYLHMTLLTPKYGDMADWMCDEIMNMADTCGVTHLKFNAGYQHKSKFFAACGKKLMIPTGINLKEKDIKNILRAAEENNDDPKKLAVFYNRLAEQIQEQMRSKNITDEGHPFVKTVKELRDKARNVSVEVKAQVKYKKFNQFFENNIMGKTYPDNSDTPVPVVNREGIETDAVKQLATGRAYVELLALYRDDENFAASSDEAKRAKYLELYNKNVFKYDKKLDETLSGLDDSRPGDRKQKKDLIKDEYDAVNSDIRSLASSLKHDFGVDIETPELLRRSYEPGKNKNRVAKGRQLSQGISASRSTGSRQRGGMEM